MSIKNRLCSKWDESAGHFGVKNNQGHHIEGSFQTEVLKTGHFKGPLEMKDFEGYDWWTRHCHVSLYRFNLFGTKKRLFYRQAAYTIIVPPYVARQGDAKGLSNEQCFGHPTSL